MGFEPGTMGVGVMCAAVFRVRCIQGEGDTLLFWGGKGIHSYFFGGERGYIVNTFGRHCVLEGWLLSAAGATGASAA